MVNPRETRTNASDSAPGVDDGPAGVTAPSVNSKPGGRGAVFIGVLVVCLIVLGLMFMPRQGERDVSKTLGAGPATGQASSTPATQPGG